MINLLSNYKMKKFRAGVLLWAGLSVAVQPLCAQKPLYRDASAPVEVRVRDLLGRMTLEERWGSSGVRWAGRCMRKSAWTA